MIRSRLRKISVAARKMWILACACACVASACALGSRASTAELTATQVAHALEAHYHGAKTLKAVFLERYSEGRNSVRAESGTAYFSRPGRMRWEYEQPESKLFLSDGRTVWFYVPSDHTVTRAPVKESTDWRTPLALLTGKADLGKLCSKIELAPNPAGAKPGDLTLRCTPRGSEGNTAARSGSSAQPLTPGSGGEIQEILLEVDPNTSWLSAVLIRQSGGVELEYSFGNWQENLPLAEVLFHFAAPKGVAIVDADSPGSKP